MWIAIESSFLSVLILRFLDIKKKMSKKLCGMQGGVQRIRQGWRHENRSHQHGIDHMTEDAEEKQKEIIYTDVLQT